MNTLNNDTFSAIRHACGNPWYDNEDVLLFKMDCRDFMQRLPANIIDLTVTSPPYNIGKEYEEIVSLENYKAWTRDWVSSVYRLTRSHGAFWLNVGYISMPERAKCLPLPYLLWDIIPFYLLQEVVWNYGAGVATKHTFSPRNEKLLWYVKDPEEYTFNLDLVRDPDVKYPNQKKNGRLKCNPLGKNPTDVWQIPKVTSGQDRMSPERTPHPAQFPVAMIERIILACSNVGDVIFDPFMGSGTTAEVALKNGRRVVGTEIRADYCEIAAKRLKSIIKPTELYSQAELFEAV